MITRKLLSGVALALVLVWTSAAQAATVGLWEFDTMFDATFFTGGPGGDPGIGGKTFFDSSGNGLDFVGINDFGTPLLDADVPSVMGTNTYSLNCNQCAAGVPRTPDTALAHRGTTGELTIEFWYRAIEVTADVGYVASFNGGTPGATERDGDWGIYEDSNGNIRFFMGLGNQANSSLEVSTLDLGQGYDPADGNWNHLAFTADSLGTLTSYFNGNQVEQSAIGLVGAATAPLADYISFSTNPAGGFGSHVFGMDEFRISDVALLPGSGTGVGELAWNAQLGTVPPVLPPRDPDLDKQWIRSRDFTISSWASTSYLDLYKDAGFNSILGGGPEALNAGVETHFLGAFTQLDNKALTDIQIALNDGYSAFMLQDETELADVPGIADVAAYIRSVDDQALIIVGLGGSSASYIDNIVTNIQPDAVIHAFYPWHGPTNVTDQWEPSLTDIALVRSRTLFHDVAYFAFIQSYGSPITGPSGVDGNGRLPTESELRAEIFSKLSAGVKGIAYYRFGNGVDGLGDPIEDFALVDDPTGVTSALYAPAAAVNAEISNLGQSLRHLTSTDWRFVNGGVSLTPPSVVDWDTLAGNGLIDAITINAPSLNRKDALVGYFTDDLSGEYFMLANTFHGDSLDAAAAAVDFTLMFDSSVNSIWRLNRLTGLAEELVLISNILNLTLPGGTGDLFKFGDGLFAGLTISTADFNGDGFVDGNDFLIFQRGLGVGSTLAEGDANGDMIVDDADLAIWETQYGTSPLAAATAAVPEPATALLLGLGMSLWMFRCRKTPSYRREADAVE